MATTTLQDIVDQLLENKKASDKTTESVSTVADLMRQQLEANRITAEDTARNRIEAGRRSGGSDRRSVIGEVAATGGNAIAGAAGGLIGLGAGIAGFMAALSVGSMGLDWLGNDYSGLGEAFGAFSDAVSHLTPAGVLALGAVTAAAIGAGVFRVNGLQIAGNITGLGIGISAFMAALAAGEVGISWINAIPAGSAKGLVSAFQIFNEAVAVLDTKSITVLGSLIAASATFGSGRTAASIIAGMTGIGLGISAFMASLAAGEVGISWIYAIPAGSGKGLVASFQMFNDAIMALTPESLAALAVVMAAGTALGASGIGAAGIVIGMGAIGAGIAAFMGALAVGDVITAVAAWTTGGEPGEALKMMLVNIFTGLSYANNITGLDLISLAEGITAIAGSLIAFGVGNLVGTLTEVGVAILGFFGVDNPFDQIMQIADKAESLTAAGTALETIAAALGKFGAIKFNAANVDFEAMALQLGKAIPTLKALAIGGEVEGSAGWFTGPVVFPDGGILNPDIRLDEMAAAIAKVNYILGQTTTYPIGSQGGGTTSGATTSGAVLPTPSTSGADLNAANTAAQAAIYNAPVYNTITNNYGGGSTSLMTVPVGTGDNLDRRDGIRRGR